MLGQYHFRTTPNAIEGIRHDLDVRFSYLRIPSLRWSWGAGVLYRQVMDGENELGEEVIGMRRVSLTAHVSRVITLPYWELGASMAIDPPWSQFSRNLPYAGLTVNLTLKRSHLLWPGARDARGFP